MNKESFDENNENFFLKDKNWCGEVEKKKEKNKTTFLHLSQSFILKFSKNQDLFVFSIKWLIFCEKTELK
jgi:hypothetical protein